ncbi:FadR/GntR family transcriptional regulator, partial [Devosia sp.]|uniref:FadR/GntR family transcriptional regulator n=1 Tax=Devosia sp. TaxID=1871048 RepID=UPI002AFE5038
MPDGALQYLEPLQNRSRIEAVLEALSTMVAQTGMKVGDKLPAEVQLAQQLGVGRSTMREALNRWEGLGIIRRRRGDGTYLAAAVLAPSGTVPIMVQLVGEQILRLLELRRCLETAIARKAAQRATDLQKREITALCDRLLESVERGKPSFELDNLFHNAIADATGNPVFGHALRQVKQVIVNTHDSPFPEADFALDSYPPHRDLAVAVCAGDADGAEAAVHII